MTGHADRLRPLLAQALDKLPKPVRFRAVNAMTGFEKALALIDIDREMASFRAITAQEEAAAALFVALQLRSYPGSERLNLGSHMHKAALWPVIDAARMSLSKGPFREVNFGVEVDPPALHISAPVTNVLRNVPSEFAEHRLTLEEPFGLLHKVGGSPTLFPAELAEIAKFHGRRDIGKHLRALTNMRNGLLYASDRGLPKSGATVEGIRSRREQSEIALFAIIGVLQTSKHQGYVLQALETLLTLVAKADALEMGYPDPSVGMTLSGAAPG